MIQETKDFIERFKGTYSKTFQVQSRVKMLEKLQLVEVDEMDTSALRLKFPPAPRSGQSPVVADGVGKAFEVNRYLKTLHSPLNVATRWPLWDVMVKVSRPW